MAIVFPISPSVNDTFTAGSITYKWDGDKWIGLGVTPADRLVDGSNSLEIDANNNLLWSGGNLGVNASSPGSRFQVDYDEGAGEVGLRLRAYNATNSKSWDISERTGNAGTLTMRNATNQVNLFNLDGVNSRVGLITETPGARFHVFSDNSTAAEPIAIFETDTGSGGECSVRIEGGASGNPDEVYLEICDKDDAASSWAIGLNDDASKLCFGYGTKATMNAHDDMQLWSDGQLTLKSQTTTDQLHLAKTTGFGYDQGTYRVLQIGRTTTASGSPGTNQTLSFNYDPSGNTSGAFTGLGSEILVANNVDYNTSILQPKSNNVGYNQLLSFGPNGEVRQPSKPSFLARPSTAETTWNVNADSWTKIPFDTETNGWDQTSTYDAANSRFTATVPGKYLFGCEIQLENPSYGSNPWMYIAFVVNGQTGGAYAKGGTRTDVAFVNFYNSYSTVHLMDLAAGDYVEMWRTGNMTSIVFKGNAESAFWGYLVG